MNKFYSLYHYHFFCVINDYEWNITLTINGYTLLNFNNYNGISFTCSSSMYDAISVLHKIMNERTFICTHLYCSPY